MRHYTSDDLAKLIAAGADFISSNPGATVNVSCELMREVLELAQRSVSLEVEYGHHASDFGPAGLVEAAMREVEGGRLQYQFDEEPPEVDWPTEASYED
jgi:hypothetical protein